MPEKTGIEGLTEDMVSDKLTLTMREGVFSMNFEENVMDTFAVKGIAEVGAEKSDLAGECVRRCEMQAIRNLRKPGILWALHNYAA